MFLGGRQFWAAAICRAVGEPSASLAGWREKYLDVEVRQVKADDGPRHQLLYWAAQAQLVVVGGRGHGGFEGMLLGSTSDALLHHAPCPVMIVRPDTAEQI